MAIGGRRNGRHFSDQSLGGQFSLIRVFDVELVVIERRHGADHARQNRHRVGVVMEPRQEVVDLLVDHGVIGDVALKVGVGLRRWQIAVQQ